jgi:hypothetical protein
VGIEGATLRVRVPDARWRQVLHRMQPQILQALRRTAGSLAPRRMGFLEGGPAAPESAPAADPVVAAELPGLVAAGAQVIGDPDIRALFESTAARYLSRSRPS